jgi:hypothetical protein
MERNLIPPWTKASRLGRRGGLDDCGSESQTSPQTMPAEPPGTWHHPTKFHSPLPREASKTGMTAVSSALSSPLVNLPWMNLVPPDCAHESILMSSYNLCINTYPTWMCLSLGFASDTSISSSPFSLYYFYFIFIWEWRFSFSLLGLGFQLSILSGINSTGDGLMLFVIFFTENFLFGDGYIKKLKFLKVWTVYIA